MESRVKVVGKDLEQINGQINHHRGEINHLKIREKDANEEVENLKGFIMVLAMRPRFSRITLTG